MHDQIPTDQLAVGASGTIGRHVTDDALSQGHRVRALVRSPGKLNQRPGLEIVVGDLTRPQSLLAAVEGVDAIVFTHGTYGSPRDAEAVDYGGVRNVLATLGDKQARIALMTAIAVTDSKGARMTGSGGPSGWSAPAATLTRSSVRAGSITTTRTSFT
jgi:uncharacterized protein YbjT (DUF2867 family)